MRNERVVITQINYISNGQVLTLEKGRLYDIYEEDATRVSGCYCSNTATQEENPNGDVFAGICLQDKENLVIDGNGATLLIHGVLTPLLFLRCKNVVLKNITIDYARPTMSEFLVKEKIEDGYLLQLSEKSDYIVENEELFWVSEKKPNGEYYWKRPYCSDKELSMYYNPRTEKTYYVQGGGVRFPCVPAFTYIEKRDKNTLFVKTQEGVSLPLGCVVQTRDVTRNALGGAFLYCKNIRLENVQIYAMHGFGLLAQYCENVSYKNVQCTPKTGRTIASNADFFHFSGCKGKIVLQACHAVGGHDDFVNVHGTHLRVIEKNETERRVTVRFMHNQTWGFASFFVGDKIEFIRWNTLCPYAKNKVLKVKKINSTDIELFLKYPLPKNVEEKDVIENTSWTPSLRIKDCYFGPSMGRGVLCTTRKKVRIIHNVFYKTGGSVLSIEDDCNFWYESGHTKDVLFAKNTVIDCAYATASETMPPAKKPPVFFVAPKVMDENFQGHVHKKIRVIKNRIVTDSRGEQGVYFFRYAKKVTIKKNTLIKE